MINHALTEVPTKRVEQLFYGFIKKVFNQFGMEQPSLDECRIILTRDFKHVMQKLSVFSKLRHRGKYGLLDKSLQRKLNLKLLILDILKQSVIKKRTLVKEVVKENDRLLIEQHHSDFKSKILVKILANHQSSNIDLERFLKKAERLYFRQKIVLRNNILNNQLFKKRLSDLEQTYKNFLNKTLTNSFNYDLKKATIIFLY
jgi:hypothetical protein